MTRLLADLANDLRNITVLRLRFDTLAAGSKVAWEAADVLDLLAKHLPPPPCDTCGGSGELILRDLHGTEFAKPCPHCDHGRVALDVWLAKVAALWWATAAAHHLRQVGRLP